MRASRVVVVSDAAVTILVSRYPALEERVFAIPNGFDPDDLDPTIEHGAVPAGQVVDFLFAGTLRRGQTVGRFFEAFGVFARTNPEARLSLLGVVDSDHVTRARAAVPPSAFRLMAPLRHREAIAAMSRAGVLVVFTGQGGAGAATMTGKLYEYLAARRPILLVGPHGPAAELVRSAGAGVTADPDDVADLARGMEAALQLARDPAYVGAPAEILDRYDRRSLARAWAALLGDVLGARS
jgi:glycosyltransferase involved in cell wall biosynthesis